MTLDPNGLDALVQAAKDRNVPLIDAKAIVRAYLAALPSSPAAVPSGPLKDDDGHEWPARLSIRDTKLHDDLGGPGQRIYTTAGRGYKRVEYVRADLASPSPPALDGAGREGIIEECARSLDDLAASFPLNSLEATGVIAARSRIRSLSTKETP